MPGEAAAASTSWFFGCHACGKCCNSAPRLLLPELFHHQARFVGCLGIRRLGFDAELFTHAFAFAAAGACPALGGDGRCAIQADRKPLVCSIVPLDATLPDEQQHAVLAMRQTEARFWGADCIRPQPATGFRELTRHLRVVDSGALALLTEQRRQQAAEQLYWGREVARLFGPELLDHPQRVRALPNQGALTVSITPVLSVVAETSSRCRERVADYVSAQTDLMHALIRDALARRRAADRAETALLRRLLQTALAFADELAQRRPPVRIAAAEHAVALEAWLEL